MLSGIQIGNYIFHSPIWWMAIPILAYLLVYRYTKREKRNIPFTFTRNRSDLKQLENRNIPYFLKLGSIFLFLGSTALILALSKPQDLSHVDSELNYGEGINIMISLDISGSMLATDFQPNRLEAAKELGNAFIDQRTSDRIGLVVYEGEAYTACPLTRNHDYLKQQLKEVQSGWLEPGTAIGTGLGTAVARMNEDPTVSKVIILLSDGENNKGTIEPIEAAELAQKKNIKVYTIGVGKEGYAAMPVNTPFGTVMQNTKVSIDEKLLTQIAQMTGGKYFRATDNASLEGIYRKINQLETSQIIEDAFEKTPPLHPVPFLIIAFIALSLGIIIEQKILSVHA